MRIAYADPPYVGCAHLYKGGTEVNHPVLIQHLQDEYPDGWALSASSPSLRYLLPLCPDDVRVSAWVKPFASFKPNVNPGYTWEPVIWRGGRDRERYEATIKDHVIELDPALASSITLKKGLTGAKPVRFCFWLFDLLGLQPNDEFVDLFPGTGIVSRVWDEWRTRSVPKPLILEVQS